MRQGALSPAASLRQVYKWVPGNFFSTGSTLRWTSISEGIRSWPLGLNLIWKWNVFM